MITRIDDPDEIATINDRIHDCWFLATRIREADAIVTIPFASRLTRRARDAWFDAELRIAHVKTWSIVDSERVEIYDFVGLVFDRGSDAIRVDTAIPLDLRLEVADFDVQIEIPDRDWTQNGGSDHASD